MSEYDVTVGVTMELMACGFTPHQIATLQPLIDELSARFNAALFKRCIPNDRRSLPAAAIWYRPSAPSQLKPLFERNPLRLPSSAKGRQRYQHAIVVWTVACGWRRPFPNALAHDNNRGERHASHRASHDSGDP